MNKNCRTLLLAAWLVLRLGANANPVEGIDYKLARPAAKGVSTRVVVFHFFSYYCPTCAEKARQVAKWRASLPADVVWIDTIVPIKGQAGKEPNHLAFHALRATPGGDAVHFVLLNAIRDQGVSFATPDALESWLAKQSLDMTEYRKNLASLAVARQTQQSLVGSKLMLETNVDFVPSIVIDGKYWVRLSNDPSPLGEKDRFAVATALVERARAERAGAQPDAGK
jgi:protein dithiol oxidoreductase (disulfide-forming)